MMEQVKSSNKPLYVITASLLNSWLNIWGCVDRVKEAEYDKISLEDKQADAQLKAYDEFIKTLNRIPAEPNVYMQKGIEYEDETIKGNTEMSPMVKDGQYQVVGKKIITINNIDVLLYGRLDVLKDGKIIDIKRVVQYTPPKYRNSAQHSMYLELWKEAKYFEYYICDDKMKIHIETYYRDQVVDIKTIVTNFLNWLSENNLLSLYKEKWDEKIKGELNR